MSRRSVAAALAVLLVQGFARPARAGTVMGGDTPQAVVARMLKAAETKNFSEMIACLEPGSRTEVTTALLMGSTMMVAFMDMGSGMASAMGESGGKMKPEDKAKADKEKAKIASAKTKFSAILKKHGLPDLMDPKAPPPEKGSAEKMLVKVDQPALAADLGAFMDEFGDKKEKSESGAPVDLPKNATDYKISGDHATAKAGAETLDFVKLEGRWFFKPPQKEAKK